MNRDKLISRLAEDTRLEPKQAEQVLNQLVINRIIPTVLQNKVLSNIAEGAGISVDQAKRAVGSTFGLLAQEPKLFEIITHQLATAWINDCDGCNACGELISQAPIREIGA